MDRKISDFRGLIVWQESMKLAVDCYRLSEGFPHSALHLAVQIRRSSISVPSNIAEGHELSSATYCHHIRVALGSLAELQTQLELAFRVGLLTAADDGSRNAQIESLQRMLRKLRSANAKRVRCGTRRQLARADDA
jgi:four helix bundle protein